MNMLTKAGRPTRFGLACGCVESFTHGNFSARMRMPSPSSGVILVTAQDDPWRVLYNGKSLRNARHAFDKYKKAVGA